MQSKCNILESFQLFLYKNINICKFTLEVEFFMRKKLSGNYLYIVVKYKSTIALL